MPVTTRTNLTNSNFNSPLFLADALTHMEDQLSTVGFINRQIEVSRKEWKKGDLINIKKAATFTVQSDAYANMAAIEEATPEDTQMAIDQYRTAGMRMTDIEEAITGQNAWDQHARRIGYALATEIESVVLQQAMFTPHHVRVALSALTEDAVIDTNRIFQELGVPEDGPQMRRMALSPRAWAALLKRPAFSQNQGSGLAGVQTQTTGDLPEKFGLVPYQSNFISSTALAANLPTGGADTAAAPTGAAITGGTKGSKTVTLGYTGLASPTVFTAGQVVQLATASEGLLAPTAGKAYRRQLYCIASSGAVSGAVVTVTLTQPLRQAHTGTWRRIQLAAADVAIQNNLAYYKDAIALAMVELPGNKPGVNIFTATNPNSGLSLRAREVYDGVTMMNALIFDCYFGVKTLDPDKMVRCTVDLSA